MSKSGRVKVLEFEQKYVHSIYDHLAIQQHATFKNNINSAVTTTTAVKDNLQTNNEEENNHKTNDTLPSKNGKCWAKIVQFLKEFSSTSIVGDIGIHFNC